MDGDSVDNTALVARELWPNGVHLQQTRKVRAMRWRVVSPPRRATSL